MYQYNLAWLTASGTSLYHWNLLAYSFLRACQEIGVLFHHFDVCGKEHLLVNEELAKWAGFGLQNAMQYLLRHSEWLLHGKGELKGKNHFLFMCRSDLTMMFHAVANNYRELGEPWVPGQNLSLAEQENWMVQNLWEMDQILQHQGSCLDKKFGWVYPMCLAEEMDLLNFAFPLVGPEVMAPIHQPLRWEQGLQVPAAPTQSQRTVFLGEAKPPATATVSKEPQAHSSTPSPSGMSNFTMAFAWLREDYQKVHKRPNTSQEQSPQQMRRRKLTESGDSTDSEISKETEMLEITSPRKTRPTHYEHYLVEGGWQLIVRIPIPEDYAATGLPQPAEYAKGTIPKCPIHERLGPEVAEDMEVTKLEQGDIADEAYLAQQANEEELFTRMKCGKEDLKAQEQRKWEEETWQWELQKKKREEEEAKKPAAFQKTEEYYQQKGRTEKPNADMERRSILKNPFPEGFSQVPSKLKETPHPCKPSHRSEGWSSGQFGQPPCCTLFDGLLDLKRFPYDHLHKSPGAMVAWAKMSINLGNLTREVNSLKYFSQYSEKTREILGVIKYCLILGIDGYRNAIANWPSWLMDTSHPILDYAPFPRKPEYAKDIQTKAQQHWENYLSWMQHWHDVSDVPLSIYYGGCHQSDSRLVVMIIYLINHVLDELVELKRIRSNTGWVLCWPHLDYTKFLVEKEWECQDVLTEETWRIKNRQWCAEQAKDTFAQLKKLVLDGINQFKRKQEAKHLRKKEEDKKYRKDIWCQSQQHGRDNARSHSMQSSRREQSMARSSSRSRPMTQDEQPQKRIERKRAFSQWTGGSEVKDTHHGSTPGEKGLDTHSEWAQAEEQPREEDNIDQDYDLTKSPFDPMGNYLGSKQETTPAIRDQPALHDSLLRYVTETKYLIDLVPTQKGTVSDKLATEAVPKQSSSSSTASSSETEDEDNNAVQDLADGEYFKQMEIDYKGTEGTREDVGGGSEVYHPIPWLEEDQLLSGEAMDTSPQTESTLLADTVKPTAEAELPATGSTAAAVTAPANLDMLTAEEFYDIPPLEDTQVGDEKDREESPASFDAMSHQMPELPTPKEGLPPEKMDRSPTKKNKRSKKGGRSGKS